ncbi:Basic leucine zipper and W2 domain-containing protein 2 [Galemys pyrenaicus]|uniref:eIF5-mimic protein 1 n=1 Tax=Galemys pyrenaicus TaxID=202257 RepID=A0A8J6AC54_GALPY|nr:Basic leucine zipper and W2 domain-containing protein 2 [Galemys pyrenaicus]
MAGAGGGAAGCGTRRLPLELPEGEKPHGEYQRGELNSSYTSASLILSESDILRQKIIHQSFCSICLSGSGCLGCVELSDSRCVPPRFPKSGAARAWGGQEAGAVREAGLRLAPCVDVNVSVLHSSIVCRRCCCRCYCRCRDRRSLQPRASSLPPQTDEKEKFEPTVFRDTLVQGLNEAGDDLEAVAKFLDSTGSRLDYRRYADTLFDILVAGSMLAPGGTRIDDGDKTKMTNHCVFSANEDHETIRNYAQVFNKLIRRYKYLEKAFEDEMKKLLLFLKAFSETEQTKLAMLSGILLGNGTLPATILTSLFTDSLVKEGIAASFAVKLFKAWMAEKDANSVTSSLRKANLDKRLLELFPVNRQSVDHFAKYFTDAGLKELSDFLRVQQSLGTRKELQKELQERLSQECPIKEVVLYVKEEMKRNELPETAVIGLLWTCIMNAVEWNKKEELVAEQALKHLKQYAPLLAVFSSQGQSELILLQKVQEYCYDNIHFMKAFQKIVVLFYKADVLSEEAILKWYKEAHVAKGKSVFLDQMKKFVEWLQNAEEGISHFCPHLLEVYLPEGCCGPLKEAERPPTANLREENFGGFAGPLRPAPPGSRPAERIDLHISTFVPRLRPISARGEAGEIGRGSRWAPAAAAAGSGERVGVAAGAPRTAASAPGPSAGLCVAASPRPGPRGKDKEVARKALLEPDLPAVAGNQRLQNGLRRLRVFQELPVRAQPTLHRESPEPPSPCPEALHLLGCPLACQQSQHSLTSSRVPSPLPTLSAPPA